MDHPLIRVATAEGRRALLAALVLMLYFPNSVAAERRVLVIGDSNGPPFTDVERTGFFDIIAAEAFRRVGLELRVVKLPAERGLLLANNGVEDGELGRVAGLESQYSNLVRVPEKLLDRHYVAFSKDPSIPSGVEAIRGRAVAEGVLKRALELPGVRAGWITAVEDGKFRLLATCNLPPALESPGAMEGPCLCRRKLLAGELDAVTNILECERLEKAQGDTQGLRYHASVPIWIGGETIGIMNLVGSERGLFSDEDARNLYAVGNQFGIALSRARVHDKLEQLVQDRTAKLTAEIAERKRAEEKIRTLNANLERRVAERTQQLDEANRAKSDFLANMSHELRTPLNSIIGFSEMLKDGVLGELDAKQRGFATDIFDAGTYLLSLINDILDLSKVEAGALQLEPVAVDVPALLKASTLIVREKALAHRIRLDAQLDPALGTMLADERKLKQIVYNLLSNAVKFTPDGGEVTLRAHRCVRAEVALDEALPARLIPLPPGEDNEFLAIAVEDSGVGIAEEHLPKLFEPFTQVDSSDARRQGGTGLGLSLVKRLAGLHGGTVGVASRAGKGSRFCVWLPWHEVAPAVQEGGTAPGV